MTRSKRRYFRFRLGEGDDDLIEWLNTLPPRQASANIKQQLRLAIELPITLINLHQKLDTLLELMDKPRS